MGIEVLLNAVGLNLVAFWRFVRPDDYSAQIFAILIVTVGAVEMAVVGWVGGLTALFAPWWRPYRLISSVFLPGPRCRS